MIRLPRKMTSSDPDPVFNRALKLLHSKSKDSEEQLRMMLDDAIKQRFGSERTLSNYLKKKESSRKQDSPMKVGSSAVWMEDTDRKNIEMISNKRDSPVRAGSSAVWMEDDKKSIEKISNKRDTPMKAGSSAVWMEDDKRSIEKISNKRDTPMKAGSSAVWMEDDKKNIEKISNKRDTPLKTGSSAVWMEDDKKNSEKISNKRDTPMKAGSSAVWMEDDKKNIQKLPEEDIVESSGSTKRKSGSKTLKSSHSKQVLAGTSASASDKMVMTAIKTEPTAIKTEDVKEEPMDQDDTKEDLVLDILEDDLACVVCRGMAIGAHNQLVECLQCHHLFHQECHVPQIEDIQINDPRSAWYCAVCWKIFNAMMMGEEDIFEPSGSTKRNSGSKTLKSSHSKQVLAGTSASTSDKMVMTAIKTEPTAIQTEDVKEEPLDQDDIKEDFALDILEDDLTCAICRGMAIGAHNQLVECLECHKLYHQECHIPRIADTEINDPRSAWYCAVCWKDFYKMDTSTSSLVHISGMSLTGIASAPQSASIKPTFVTSTTKSSSPSFTSSGKTFGGLSQASAKPASSSSKSVASAAGSSKLVMPNINIINAEKKLQIMKKKAAKQQEKRKHSK